MGQKQILLIVLGVIIVGIAVSAGIRYFHHKAVHFNRDAVVLDLNQLATDAQAYYKKKTGQGGGNGSFMGYDIPEKLKSNENGTYRVLSVQPNRVLIQGIGREKREADLSCTQGGIKISYRILVEPESTTLHQVF